MVQLGLVGIDEVSAEATACGMPLEAQIARLERALEVAGVTDAEIRVADLLDLGGDERHAALDAMVADEPSPYVIVDGRVVCTGPIDAVAVLGALS